MKRMFVMGLALLASAEVHAGAVVVAADSSQAELSSSDAQRLFLGRSPSVGGNPAVVVYQNGSERSSFENAVLKKSGAELTSYWSKLIFTGKAKAPVEVADDQAVKDYVKANAGAIGYVSDGAVDDSVKVLLKY